MNEFRAKLDAKLKKIDSEWKQSVIDSNRSWAQLVYEQNWIDGCLVPYRERAHSYSYVARWVKDGELDMALVDKDGERDWRDIREQYLVRTSDKLEAISFGHEVTSLQLDLNFKFGVIRGNALIDYASGDKIKAQIDLRWNRSKYGKQFSQYPTYLYLNNKRQALEWLTENFAIVEEKETRLPTKVEGDKALKAASTLAFNLVNREELQAYADKRNVGGYCSGVRGPKATITCSLNALKLPKDYTADQAVELLWNSLSDDQKAQLKALVTEDQDRAPLGKKGKEKRDLNKGLEKLELVYRSDRVKANKWGRQLVALVKE